MRKVDQHRVVYFVRVLQKHGQNMQQVVLTLPLYQMLYDVFEDRVQYTKSLDQCHLTLCIK